MSKYGLLLGVIFALPVQADVYKWTDEHGVVHFSDKAHPNANKIDLPEEQTYSPPTTHDEASPEPRSTSTSTESSNEPALQDPVEEDQAVAPIGYTVVKIGQPKDQETIRNNQGYIPIIVQTVPELRKGDTIQIMLDGKPQGPSASGTAFELKDIDRGAHTITANILNEKQEIIKSSAPITIYLQRPRVGMVPGTRR